MYCDACGNALQPGQAFCSKWSKQIVGAVSVTQPLPGRVEKHLHLLGVLWFALSAFNALGGLFLLILGSALFPHLREIKGVPPDVPVGFLTSLFTTLGIVVLAKAACGFGAGWGLLQRESWARLLALVLAFISLFNVPLGTALGVYTLWALLPSQSQEEYEALAVARMNGAVVRAMRHSA